MKPSGRAAMTVLVLFFRFLSDCMGERSNRWCPANCTCDEGQMSWTCLENSDELRELGDVGVRRLTLRRQTNFPVLWTRLAKEHRLENLDVVENRLQELPGDCFRDMSDLRVLNASHNDLTSLEDGVFDGLTSLRRLGLSFNRIRRIGRYVFTDRLGSIERIDLRENDLMEIDSWPLLLCSYERFVDISFDYNNINNFTNSLNFSMKYPRRLTGFVGLGHNEVPSIFALVSAWVSEESSFWYAVHQLFKSVYISVNPIDCSCVDYVFIALRMERVISSLMSLGECFSGYSLDNTSPADITCDVRDDCPERCTCLQRPSSYTLVVDCSAAFLKSLPERLPSRKPMTYLYTIPLRYELIFAGNSIASIENNSILSHAISLDFSLNSISSVSPGALRSMRKVKRIFLNGNNLRTLPREIQSLDFKTREWKLHNNPWDCSCKNAWLRDWFEVVPIDRDVHKILCSTPRWHANKDLFKADFCQVPPTDYRRLLEVILSILSGIVFLAALLILSWKRWKYYIYEKSGIRYIFDIDECTGDDMSHDVFLSSSERDLAQARLFLEKLELEYGFRVIYHSRDFSVGELVIENIFRAIKSSKRTLCLISEDFLSSYWCLEEFKLAYLNDMVIRRRRLLVVVLEEVDWRNDGLPTEVKSYFKTRSFIEAFKLSEEDVWKNLVYCLPTPEPKCAGETSTDLLEESDDPFLAL